MSDIDHLIEQRDRAREQFATIGDMRPGSLSANFTKCGNPNCHCAHDVGSRHGPYYIISRTLEHPCFLARFLCVSGMVFPVFVHMRFGVPFPGVCAL